MRLQVPEQSAGGAGAEGTRRAPAVTGWLWQAGGTWQGGPSFESHLKKKKTTAGSSHLSQPLYYPFGPCRGV